MKMKYVVLSIISLLVACGGGPNESKATNSASPKVNPIEITKADEKTAVQHAQTQDNRTSSLTAALSSTQDPTMTKEQLDKAKAIIAKVTEKDMENLKAGRLYKMHCALCHGFRGKMQVNGAKDLSKSVLPLHESVAQVYFGKGLMNPYKGVLEDAEIVAVCQYIENKLRK